MAIFLQISSQIRTKKGEGGAITRLTPCPPLLYTPLAQPPQNVIDSLHRCAGYAFFLEFQPSHSEKKVQSHGSKTVHLSDSSQIYDGISKCTVLITIFNEHFSRCIVRRSFISVDQQYYVMFYFYPHLYRSSVRYA